MGKHYPEMQCSITVAALSFFREKTKKIALTGVQSRVRETRKTATLIFNSVLFY